MFCHSMIKFFRLCLLAKYSVENDRHNLVASERNVAIGQYDCGGQFEPGTCLHFPAYESDTVTLNDSINFLTCLRWMLRQEITLLDLASLDLFEDPARVSENWRKLQEYCCLVNSLSKFR